MTRPAVARKLKVYQGSLDGQYSYCVATSSLARVATIARIEGFNISKGSLRDYWTETSNAEQIAAATAQPGVLLRSVTRSTLAHDYQPVRDLLAPRKFGYAHMVEMEEIKASLAGRGLDPVALHFEAIRVYEDRHKNDETHRQRSERLRREWAAKREARPRDKLTAEEIAYLIDRLDGVNDPVGQSAKAALEAMQCHAPGVTR